MNKENKGYSTTTEDDGANYRQIAEIMTVMGFPMNHSSAHNHILRTMKKFCKALIKEWDLNIDEAEMMKIVKTPEFQCGIGDLMHTIEDQRRHTS